MCDCQLQKRQSHISLFEYNVRLASILVGLVRSSGTAKGGELLVRHPVPGMEREPPLGSSSVGFRSPSSPPMLIIYSFRWTLRRTSVPGLLLTVR